MGCNAHNTGWTAERKEQCKLLYIDQKKSATLVGTLMGVSRNAVIGVMNRMGFRKENPTHKTEYPKRTRKPRPRRARTAAERVKRSNEPPLPFLVRGEDIPPLLESVLDLKMKSCTYPYGTTSPYPFCGRKKVRGAFCAQHAELCYRDPLYRHPS